jgi:hypothetical protein
MAPMRVLGHRPRVLSRRAAFNIAERSSFEFVLANHPAAGLFRWRIGRRTHLTAVEQDGLFPACWRRIVTLNAEP